MDPSPRFWELFLEVFEGLPRQGPGDRQSAQRALAACSQLPPRPSILDMGCGLGCQTFHLAELTNGRITAVDNLQRWIESLNERVQQAGLQDRIFPLHGDMTTFTAQPGSFHLIWSEGALYHMGIEPALSHLGPLLAPEGYVSFTEPVWVIDDPHPDIKASFDFDYPAMGRVVDVLRALDTCRFKLIDHFTLPDRAWWDDFYTPMEHRVAHLRDQYAEDPEALEILTVLAREPELHRLHGSSYAYEFFIAQRG